MSSLSDWSNGSKIVSQFFEPKSSSHDVVVVAVLQLLILQLKYETFKKKPPPFYENLVKNLKNFARFDD